MNAALTRVCTATALMVGRSTHATAKLVSPVCSVKTKPMSVVLTRALVECVLMPSCPTRVEVARALECVDSIRAVAMQARIRLAFVDAQGTIGTGVPSTTHTRVGQEGIKTHSTRAWVRTTLIGFVLTLYTCETSLAVARVKRPTINAVAVYTRVRAAFI